MNRDYRGYHRPLPPASLLEISTVEWAVLVRLSDICQINYTGTTKISAYTLSAELNLPLAVVWSAMRKLHELEYVAVSDHEGNQYVDHGVLVAFEVDRIRARAAKVKQQEHIPNPNIKPIPSAPIQPQVAPRPKPKPKQAPAPKSTVVPPTDLETDLSGYGMM